jgi:glutamate formiminotransferase / 5-formyltetrahydrofolate cyclo-ligase
VLECVVNLSEGRDTALVERIAAAAGAACLDLHSDPWHNRSVLTLAGPGVESAARDVARRAVELLDLRHHSGVHPRLGVLDVVPFVPLDDLGADRPNEPAGGDDGLIEAIAARDAFARFAGDELDLPCFLYGTGRSLPEIRRHAFGDLTPDTGPPSPHPTAGACCVGARPLLVAYNLWLAGSGDETMDAASDIARSLRSESLRVLALRVGETAQVSCNLVAPLELGPAELYDLVAARAAVDRAELVGLVPRAVLDPIPPTRWAELDLSDNRTIEARLASALASRPPT